MSTGHYVAVSARVPTGSTVAVVGDEAVGLCGVLAAKRLGAERIIILGPHEWPRDCTTVCCNGCCQQSRERSERGGERDELTSSHPLLIESCPRLDYLAVKKDHVSSLFL